MKIRKVVLVGDGGVGGVGGVGVCGNGVGGVGVCGNGVGGETIIPVKVWHRDNKGGDTEDRQDQQLPGPEPIMDRGSHSTAGGHT